ncbi:MAG TPA: phosphoribosylformylglycinamidine synthase subunit PurL, partial [Gemmataceae bacterium]|nr:phosphoribosylformylglycinamidine synthase subunit PurL [Gemmataceae bacterium]
SNYATVMPKPGVMDPASLSVDQVARNLGLGLSTVRTFRRYFGAPRMAADAKEILYRKVLANDAIEEIHEGPLSPELFHDGAAKPFRKIIVPIRELNNESLMKLSFDGQLALSLAEMQTIQAHFRELHRDPTDAELETIAQTWSEHCSHKTLRGLIDMDGRQIDNLLKGTIFAATTEIRRRLGEDDWCVSVFSDNAGIVKFDDRYHVCFKVETHNHPSAIEPYGGANTGLGGVIRDVLGTGLGAKPICNTDVFCFARPDLEPETLPAGVLHPRKVIQGVVAGVRDYGNRMGIPTINGAVCFDERYLANPLVFCGTVGLIPVDRCHKEPQPGDLIVALGGRTGRDGIHGATFSSIELSAASETVSGGAVQIGNPIAEKKLMDVLLVARDRGLYSAVTDCGAGGFSSAIGEMGEKLGAEVRLEQAPLKYQGLTYTEIWISESQERMILAVPPENWSELAELCLAEDVEATVLGHFESTGKLRLFFHDEPVAALSMNFLHEGRPPVIRRATFAGLNSETREGAVGATGLKAKPRMANFTDDLLKILSTYNVCSKEWIIRQYDHEVQGGTVIKPLVGPHEEGPGDAAVITPVLGSWKGLAIGCGICPQYGERDPYAMAAAAIDEAVRNVVAVGADPKHIALLDNFCWGNTDRPETLGSLVRAAEACYDVSLAYGTPFISGKDSLNNEFRSKDKTISIPPTLLISALGRVLDVRKCVTMDFKEPSNLLYLIGVTKEEMGASHYNLVNGVTGGTIPRVDLQSAPSIFEAIHKAVQAGLIRSCHDLSEGGLAVALAEMALAGGLGADLTSAMATSQEMADEVILFSESPTRFAVEVVPSKQTAFERLLGDHLPHQLIGRTCKEPRLRIAGRDGEWVVWTQLAELKSAWQKPLKW